jgi:hypothetical protein
MPEKNEIIQNSVDFIDLYNRSYRLVAAVFSVCNVMDEDQELKTKIKNLSLDLISIAVNLKDINFSDARKLVGEVEKKSLLLMSILDIASISLLISPMNGDILREEFKLFISELRKFLGKFEIEKNLSVKNIFELPVSINSVSDVTFQDLKRMLEIERTKSKELTLENYAVNSEQLNKNGSKSIEKNGNGHKRKDTRKSTILEFIKGHNNVNIKDIVPNIVGCSEKTIQRELIGLINEGKIKKEGERRWSRYSVI